MNISYRDIMIKSSDLSEKITAETLPTELKTMIAQQAHSDGMSALATALMTVPLQHYAGLAAPFILNPLGDYHQNSSVISKTNEDMSVDLGKYKVPYKIASVAFELFTLWGAYHFTKNQRQDWLTESYVQQYDSSDSLLASTKDLSNDDKKDITFKALLTSAIAGGLGYGSPLVESWITKKNDNSQLSSLIPEGAKPWIASAAFGTIAFLVANEIFSQNRKEEINDIRTDISFVKRLHEEKSFASNQISI